MLSVTCTESHYYYLDPCSNVMDGSHFDWYTYTENNGAWVELTFPQPVIISQVKVWQSCWIEDQYQNLVFTFSDATTQTVSRHGYMLLYMYSPLLYTCNTLRVARSCIYIPHSSAHITFCSCTRIWIHTHIDSGCLIVLYRRGCLLRVSIIAVMGIHYR